MKPNFYTISFMTCAILLFAQCEKIEPSNADNDNKNKATGTFTSDSFDKEKWGDFELVLELNKPVYSIGEQINVLTYFLNVGDKTITLDGILPYRQSANPPTIEVQLNDTLIFRTSKFLENLNNENDIIIEPNKKVELNKFNLLQVEGQLMILDKENNLYHGVDTYSIESSLSKGSYKIHSFFHTMPHVYCSNTDTLTFTIE